MTRKATWTRRRCSAGQAFAVANSAELHRPWRIDYSGGFAATGGAMALRVVGGATVDRSDGETPRLVRGGRPRLIASGRFERRATTRAEWPGMRRTRTTTSRIGLSMAHRRRRVSAPPCRPPALPNPTPTAVPSPTPTSVPDTVDADRRHPCSRSNADADADPDINGDATPTPTATPTPRRRRPRTDADATRHRPDADPDRPRLRPRRRARSRRRGLADGTVVTIPGVLTTPRRPRIGPWRVRPGFLGRDRAVSRRRR